MTQPLPGDSRAVLTPGTTPGAGRYREETHTWAPPDGYPGQAAGDAWAEYPVAARGLTKVFPVKGRKGRGRGSKTAVSELDLTVEAGTIFGLLGPNGSGKTTTIDMITGVTPPTSGTVTIFGRPPRELATKWLIGVISQETALYKKLTGRQNLMTHAMLYGFAAGEARKRADAVLELTDLREHADERVAVYSGGMARRLQIGQNLLHGPKLLFMDEPTLGVDPTQRAGLWRTIRDLSRNGVAVLLTTNMLDEAARLCGRVAIIDHGRLVAEDTPDQLQRQYGHIDITVRVAATREACKTALDDALLIPGVRAATGRGTAPGEARLVITTDTDTGTTGRVVKALSRDEDLTIIDIETSLPALDEVFAELTGPHKVLK